MNSTNNETDEPWTGLPPGFTVLIVILSCELAVIIFLLGGLYSGTGATLNDETLAGWTFAVVITTLICLFWTILLRPNRIDDRLDRFDDRLDSNRRKASTEVRDLESRLEKKIDDNHNRLRSEVNDKHNQLRDEMNEKHNQLRSEMNEKHNQLRTQIQGLQTTLLSHEGPVEKPKRRA